MAENEILEGLTYEEVGIIRRIPLETRGTSKRGTPWTRGGVYLEILRGENGSAPLFLTVWGDEMVEQVNRIGVGKKVKVVFRIETRERFDLNNYSVNVTLVSISGLSEAENFLYNINKDRKV